MGKESLRGRLGKDDAGRSRQRGPSDWLTPTQGERRGESQTAGHAGERPGPVRGVLATACPERSSWQKEIL